MKNLLLLLFSLIVLSSCQKSELDKPIIPYVQHTHQYKVTSFQYIDSTFVRFPGSLTIPGYHPEEYYVYVNADTLNHMITYWPGNYPMYQNSDGIDDWFFVGQKCTKSLSFNKDTCIMTIDNIFYQTNLKSKQLIITAVESNYLPADTIK